MSLGNIVDYRWDLGNGVKTNEAFPRTDYDTGAYDVRLIVTLDTGEELEVVKKVYIVVAEQGENQLNIPYLKDRDALHFGWNNSTGKGWSINKRDKMVAPITSSSVYNIEINGKIRTVVWDYLEGVPYIINVSKVHNQEAVYKDRVEVDGNGDIVQDSGYDIPTRIVFPEISGEMYHYGLIHQETSIVFRPELLEDSLFDNTKIDFKLIADRRKGPVEIRYDEDPSSEVRFFYSNTQTETTKSRQLEVSTNTSKYQLLFFEAYFKSIDKQNTFKAPSYTLNAMEAFAGVRTWFFTGGDLGYDRVSKVSNKRLKRAIKTSSVSPVDGYNSWEFVKDFDFKSYGDPGTAFIFWGKDIEPSGISYDANYGIKTYDTLGDFTMYYKINTSGYGALIPMAEGGTLFDYRVINFSGSDEDLRRYLFEYRNKLSDYLPY